MSPRSVSLSAMFGWIPGTFRLVGRALPGFAGASVLTLLIGFAMMLPVWLIAGLNPLDPNMSQLIAAQPGTMLGRLGIAYAVVLLLYLVLYPPIVLGWSRLCRRVDTGAGASALDIFAPFRESATWFRGIGLALAGLLVFLVVFALFGLAFWGTIMQLIQASAARQLGAPATLPGGLGALVLGYFLLFGVLVLWQWTLMIAFNEVALRPTGVWASLGRAALELLANAHKLLVFGVCLFVALVIAVVVLGVLLAVFGSALSLVGPKALMTGVLLLELPLTLVMYPLMFASGYCMWKSFLGDQPAGDVAPLEDASFAA